MSPARFDQNSKSTPNSTSLRSMSNCTSQSKKISHHHERLRKKFPKPQGGNTKKWKSSLQKRRTISVRRATIPITPQMIRVAVKELQTKRVYISSALIASHLRRCYPIENDPSALKRELNEKLNCAVSVGLIAKCGDDKYCIPTLREQASLNKTALTAFWDTYYRSDASATKNQPFNLGIPRVRAYKKRASGAPKHSYSSVSDYYQEFDEFDNQID